MISPEFKNSKYQEVFHLTAFMIRLGINSVPWKGTMIQFLDDPESRPNIGPQVTREQINILRQVLRNERDEGVMVKSSPKKAEVKSWRNQESYDPTDHEQCSFEIHESHDLDVTVLWRMSLQTQELHLKGKEESETHILRRLKESAPKLTAEQMFATVRYRVKRQEVIVMQREAADLLRRSVDSEYHEHFDVPHNRGSANDVLGSINLKALMDK